MSSSRAAVATSEPHAADAAAAQLAGGGNAVDAAIVAASCLTVTEPTSNGLGGDLFALVYQGGQLHGLDAAGAAPAALSAERVRRAGHQHMPLRGWETVTVPGEVSGWQELADRFASRPLSELLAPAIDLARDGFEVGPVTAAAWSSAFEHLHTFDEWRRVFAPGGSAPGPGNTFRNPDLASSLAVIASEGASGFYETLARSIVAHAADSGGYLALEDFQRHEARWVAPLQTRFGNLEITELGAPTQGVVALLAASLLDGEAGTHSCIEAIKLAFEIAYAHVGDPTSMAEATASLLEPARIAQWRERLGGESARDVRLDLPPAAGTVLLCTADSSGGMTAVIQSNFHGFGSGIVVPGTGIALHNRGHGFNLTEGHPNCLEPGKRPYHTILPGFVRNRNTTEHGPFGCMGGQMQPQGHLQLMTALASGCAPDEAVSRPRWRWTDDGRLLLETGFDPAQAADLAARGHRVEDGSPSSQFGGAQMILRRADGTLRAGSDPRKDGKVAWA